MHAYSNRRALSAALTVSPLATTVGRDTVKAALWQTLGWNVDEGRVARLLMVIDAYTDTCARRAAATWVRGGHGDEVPPPSLSHGQMLSVKRALDLIRASVPVVNLNVPPVTSPAEPAPEPLPKPLPMSVLSALPPAPVPAPQPAVVKKPRREMVSFEDNDPLLEVDDTADVPEGANAVSVTGEPLYRCGKCKKLKERGYFYGNTSRGNGVDYQCKACKRVKGQLYREAKREERDRLRQARQQHIESISSAAVASTGD